MYFDLWTSLLQARHRLVVALLGSGEGAAAVHIVVRKAARHSAFLGSGASADVALIEAHEAVRRSARLGSRAGAAALART